MKIINWIKDKIRTFKRERKFKKRLKEMKKRDPFTYKNY